MPRSCHLTPADIAAQFTPAWSYDPLFYNHAAALRLELAAGDTPFEYLETAWSRAISIAERVFTTADLHLGLRGVHDDSPHAIEQLDAALAWYALPPRSEYAHRIRPAQSSQSEPDPRSDDNAPCIERIAPLNPANIRNALAAALWYGFVIDAPAFPADIYLIDPARGIIGHAYDERGFDLISNSVDALRPWYETFSTRLLDHDRPRMDAVFATD